MPPDSTETPPPSQQPTDTLVVTLSTEDRLIIGVPLAMLLLLGAASTTRLLVR